jgi:hypothetical protein
MTSKKPTTTTEPVKKPRAQKKLQQQTEELSLKQREQLGIYDTKNVDMKVKKTTKKPKEEPVAQPSVPVKSTRAPSMVKGSNEAKQWGARMRELKLAKKNQQIEVV